MSNSTRATAFAAAAAALLMASCGGGGSGTGMSTLNLGLTDAAVTGVTKVWIQFAGVEVKPANGNPIDFNFTPERGFDLLTLQNGTTGTFLNGAVIPAGDYQWVRLMVDTSPGASYVVDSTGQHDLVIPSGAETGLKLIQGFTMPVGGVADFTVDFVLSKSLIAPPGQSPDYLLKPVLRLVDNAQVGTVSGTFQPTTLAAQSNCGTHAPVVYVYPGANAQPDDIYNPPAGATDVDTAPLVEPLTTTTATLNSMSVYAYSVAFLPAGTYTVAFTCDPDDPTIDEDALTPNPIHFDVNASPVTVTANAVTTVNF
ncbi:MAG TPA: DUF4382 domain-containing protein [Steroidobacteraceae bacterium]|nr:DUF4382 domain-containing protein [Steroidobacteraceae bacterium]